MCVFDVSGLNTIYYMMCKYGNFHILGDCGEFFISFKMIPAEDIIISRFGVLLDTACKYVEELLMFKTLLQVEIPITIV